MKHTDQHHHHHQYHQLTAVIIQYSHITDVLLPRFVSLNYDLEAWSKSWIKRKAERSIVQFSTEKSKVWCVFYWSQFHLIFKRTIRYFVGSAMFKVVHSIASIQHSQIQLISIQVYSLIEIGATYSELFGIFEVQYMPLILNSKKRWFFRRISFLSTREKYRDWTMRNKQWT